MGLTEYTLHCKVLLNKQAQQKRCVVLCYALLYLHICTCICKCICICAMFMGSRDTLHCAVFNSESDVRSRIQMQTPQAENSYITSKLTKCRMNIIFSESSYNFFSQNCKLYDQHKMGKLTKWRCHTA